MQDVGTLATVASIIAGFGGTMLVFRIQRELQMLKQGEKIWIAFAEWLLISATLISLLLVIVPIVSFPSLSGIFARLPAAGCSAAAILLAGYILAIQAHYRLILGANRTGPRTNPEPAERAIVLIITCVAFLAFLGVLIPFW